jgi:hypothetical protein
MSKLDYSKMLFLDAEDLAEGGILRAYQSVRENLARQQGAFAQCYIFETIMSRLAFLVTVKNLLAHGFPRGMGFRSTMGGAQSEGCSLHSDGNDNPAER